MLIDFRSDTVTRPGKEMLSAMMEAKVGDDVYGEDPSINELESLLAAKFGMEEGLFCPSGTMTNQIAIKCHTQPGDEVICDELAHVYQYEGGGISFNSGASVKLLKGDRGRINSAQVLSSINPEDDHRAHTSLVCLENTSNRGGGSCYDFQEILKIAAVCRNNQLLFHLDGARLWNALIAKNEQPKDYGDIFDSISVCLSKGLGCPAGSVLLGNRDFIRKGRRIRKLFGGGMRQAGFLAAAGLYALKNNIERLAEDHVRARRLAEVIAGKNFVKEVLPVETNIILFDLKESLNGKSGSMTSDELVEKLKEKSILSYAISPLRVRLITHLDISDKMIDESIRVFNQL